RRQTERLMRQGRPEGRRAKGRRQRAKDRKPKFRGRKCALAGPVDEDRLRAPSLGGCDRAYRGNSSYAGPFVAARAGAVHSLGTRNSRAIIIPVDSRVAPIARKNPLGGPALSQRFSMSLTTIPKVTKPIPMPTNRLMSSLTTPRPNVSNVSFIPA